MKIVQVALVTMFCLASFAGQLTAADQVLIASKHGVVSDGSKNNADAIQSLIDKCSSGGGGTVVIDKGIVVSGMIYLKNNVTLKIAEGATLQCTGKKEDYPFCPVDFLSYYPKRRSMVYAQNQSNIAVTGKGTIDGAADSFNAGSSESDRVSLIRFDGCKDVSVKDITLQKASMWTQHFYRTDNLSVSGITIDNYMKNDDGLNIDGCHNVTVTECTITSHDDAITLKNTSHRANKDIKITNCRLNSKKSALKFGTESYDGFINVVARDITITGGRDAIALFSVDGASIENILVENVEITDAVCPISIILGDRLRTIEGDTKTLKTGSVKNVIIRNVKATGATWATMITGTETHPATGVTLDNIDISYGTLPGGKKNAPRGENDVKQDTKDYPKSNMFRALNAWGIFVRHASDITFKNMKIAAPKSGSKAHMAYFENVPGLNISNMQVEACENTLSFIKVKKVRNAKFDVNWPASDKKWIEFLGEESEGITIVTELSPDQAKSNIINSPKGMLFSE